MTNHALVAVALILASTSPALADDGDVPIAIGVNAPFRWWNEGPRAYAGSVSVGISRKAAIRVNVAMYENAFNLARELVLIAQGGYSEGMLSGRTVDLGAGYVHYSRRLWDGFMCETGALVRLRDQREVDIFATPEDVRRDTTLFGARVMVGWSWLIADHAFIAVAIGGSAGYEHGVHHTAAAHGDPVMSTNVRRTDVNGEGYLRIGGAFDL